jgi:biopolymer transport protein ExbD
LNLAKAHAKARAAMKRREEQIEQDELEGGEINLIPYLDIVTNLMLFLLASVSTGLILGQINTTLPDRAPPSAATTKEDTPPDERALGLVAWVDNEALRLYAEDEVLNNGDKKTPIFKADKLPDRIDPLTKKADPVPVYDWKGLNDKLYEVAARWKDKNRVFPTYRITLVADPKIPYGAVISMMDAVRCKIPDKVSDTPCILPRIGQGEDGKPLIDPKTNYPVLIGPDGKPLEGTYNPDTMALFHDIVFSPGTQ